MLRKILSQISCLLLQQCSGKHLLYMRAVQSNQAPPPYQHLSTVNEFPNHLTEDWKITSYAIFLIPFLILHMHKNTICCGKCMSRGRFTMYSRVLFFLLAGRCFSLCWNLISEDWTLSIYSFSHAKIPRSEINVWNTYGTTIHIFCE